MRQTSFISKALLSLSLSFCFLATEAKDVVGFVKNKYGEPVVGAIVRSENNPTKTTFTTKDGMFTLGVEVGERIEIESVDYSKITIIPTDVNNIVLDKTTFAVQMGNGIIQSKKESTASVGLITSDDIMKSSSMLLGNALYGRGLGLTTLQNPGFPWGDNPSFFVRGRNTITTNSPLVLVDGIERPLNSVVREEVETITILKDAPSLALYGLRGSSGVILITTKEGIFNGSQIDVSYDHGFVTAKELPKMVDGPTYSKAVNEAQTLDGASMLRFNDAELKAFENGQFPNYYPNVNWLDQIFGNKAYQNIYNITMRGGGQKVRYATVVNLQNYTGMINPTNTLEGKSSQLMSSKLNVRTNLDINLSKTTNFKIKVLGSLLEYNRSGTSETDFIPLAYNTPAIAMPIKTTNNEWGGSDTWKKNPVAEVAARGYGKSNARTLYADWTLKQDMNKLLKGLSAEARFAFDSYAQYWEQVSQTYRYERNTMKFDLAVTKPDSLAVLPNSYVATIFGQNSIPTYSTQVSSQWRRLNAFGKINYNRIFENSKLDANLILQHDQYVQTGQHQTYNRQSIAAYLHYAIKDKYFVDGSFSMSGSNRLQPGHKFGYLPAIGASWIVSDENFMKGIKAIDYLKIRASHGLTGSDYVTEVNLWEQTFGGGGSYYFGQDISKSVSGLAEQRTATELLKPEISTKSNVAMELRMLKGLELTVDLFYEKNSNILVSSEGGISSIIGVGNAYENAGIVSNKGIELALSYDKKVGDFYYNVGANFTYYKNKIINRNEEFRQYDYLKRTGRPIGQIFGYQAIGFFADQTDIANSPTQMFSNVMPGDIKFKDQNGDKVINSYDQVALGYNTDCPEIYYSFYLNVEYKGFGLDAMFQGVGNYTSYLNTNSIFWGLRNSYYNISQHLYDNRWTPENQNSLYPRLTTLENANNYNTNTVWLADASYLKLRNCEIYYRHKMNKYGITGIKTFVRGNDLLTLANFKIVDLETYSKSSNGAYPNSSSINVGMTVSF